ncbi:RsmB/NOP family class I SAM-dependent RNA methyltransferase [Arthrobacter roseus]|uniref:RsmB/NOP family class I SAM-dependent RNA methyltransferase n=1 Tax=Arthrobacter roseus TaxID=136274 RepID=UPI001965ACB8|nr:transcription antitermination factor NusB [Arthrobacter roseus]MBM7848413.1 16S rRNA (cytosine967-C5)-methyltransferase [Arthrobacter roseus]
MSPNQSGRQASGDQNRRRNTQGRERNRGGQRDFSQAAPSQRKRAADPARLVAFEVLRAVSEEDSYGNLVLPEKIRNHRLDRRAAAFATELTYGALRGQGFYDAVLATCVDRPLAQLDPAILDALRIGAHQLLAMRVPHHAALDETVSLGRAVIGAGPAGLINAVLRKVTRRDREEWIEELTSSETDPTRCASIRYSHPEWIVRALRQSLSAHGRPVTEIDELLAADNAAPVVNLVALPGIGTLDEARDAGGEDGDVAPDSMFYSQGDVARLESVRSGVVRVQDAGSQLVARAAAAAELGDGPDKHWLDLCAGPGGKAALLAALAQQRGAVLTANEPAKHRARLVTQALGVVGHESWSVRQGDGRDIGKDFPGHYDRILVDAPCTGLGALRRRPESRWRRQPSDLADLAVLQRELLAAAMDAVRPGGVVVYATCSPHPAETITVVDDMLRNRKDIEAVNAPELLECVGLRGEQLDAGTGTTAQLWPHVHVTDGMFMAVFRKNQTKPV